MALPPSGHRHLRLPHSPFDEIPRPAPSPSVKEVHHYHHGPSYPYVPLVPTTVTNVYTGSSAPALKQDADAKKKKDEKKEDNFLGAVLLGALTVGGSYVVTSEYVKWRRLANIAEKMSVLKIANDTSLTSNAHVKEVLRDWKKWYSSYTSTTRLFHLAKVAGFLSAGAISFGLWKNMDNVMMDGFLGLVTTGAYTVGLWTLYNTLWKKDEEKLMNTLVQKFNQEALESVPFPEPLAPASTPSASTPSAPTDPSDVVASLYPSYARQ